MYLKIHKCDSDLFKSLGFVLKISHVHHFRTETEKSRNCVSSVKLLRFFRACFVAAEFQLHANSNPVEDPENALPCHLNDPDAANNFGAEWLLAIAEQIHVSLCVVVMKFAI